MYSAVMPEFGTSPQLQELDEARGAPPERDVNFQDLGRRRPRTQTPEGWVTKIERGDGKVWVGFFHVWVTSKDGERLRRKKEKVLGPAALPKHEALKKLAAYIHAFTCEEPARDHRDPDVRRFMGDFLRPEIGPVVPTLPGNYSIHFCDSRSARDWQATAG